MSQHDFPVAEPDGAPQYPPPQYQQYPPASPFQQYPPPPYQQYQQYPTYQQYPGPGQGRSQSTNGLAIASMVLGIVCLYGLGSVLALIFGFVARGQIRDSGGQQKGSGMATAGIILGFVGIGIMVLFVFILAASSSSSGG